MSKDNTEITNVAKWKGYSFDELQYQKALTLIRQDMLKEKLTNQTKSALDPMTSTMALGERLWTGLVGNVSSIEYIIMGFRMTKSIIRWWNKRKKAHEEPSCDHNN